MMFICFLALLFIWNNAFQDPVFSLDLKGFTGPLSLSSLSFSYSDGSCPSFDSLLSHEKKNFPELGAALTSWERNN